MSVKALKTQLLAAVAMVIVAAVALSSSTYAWFAAQTTVTAQGMQVNAKTVGGLLVSDNVFDVTKGESTYKSLIDFAVHDKTLYAATHDEAMTEDSTGVDVDANSYLKYNSNPSVVDKATGNKIDDNAVAAIELKSVPASSGEQYYKDYIAYIAASADDLAGQNLEVVLKHEDLTDDSDVKNLVFKATTVDFYVEEVASDNAAGTPTLKALAYKGNISVAKKDTTTVTLLEGGIPAYNDKDADEQKCLKVTMRVYIDGALQQEDGKAYVRTTDVTNDTFAGKAFSLEFNAVVPATP